MALLSWLSVLGYMCLCPSHLRKSQSCMLSASTAVQVHHGMNSLPGDEEHMETVLRSRGYDMSRHGEYDVWASPDLHPFLRHKQAAPQPI